MRKILFDTEREEARAATEQQLRQHQQQQRMMMGMLPPNAAGTVLPAMSMPAAAMHPGMMAYAPGAMAPMMFINPAMFMHPPQQQQLQPAAKTNAAGAATVVQPTMQPMMMMDQYQQAAMFQFMANPMLMNPFMQFQPPAQQSPPANVSTPPASGNVSNGLSVAITQAENPAAHGGATELGNAESQSLQEAKRDLCGSDTNSVSDQTVLNNAPATEDVVQAVDSYGEEHIAAI